MSFLYRCTPAALALAAAVIFCPACSQRGANADFYYPIDDLEDGLVYAYESVDSPPLAPYAWYFRSVVTPDSTVLASTRYDHYYEPRQFANERIVASGSLLRDLRVFTPTDSASTEVQAEILSPALFSFEPPEASRVLINSVRLQLPQVVEEGQADSLGFRQNPPPPDTYTLTRNRSYLRDTTWTGLGQTHDAQLWRVLELTEQDRDGTLGIETETLEVYAEDIGLVYTERRYSNGARERYQLAERFVMDTLVARAGQ